MFRRKKESGDDGGHVRINRLLEDRRRELAESGEEETADDTISFNRGTPELADEPDERVSLLDARSPYRGAPAPMADDPDPAPDRPLQTRWNSPPPLDEEDEPAQPTERFYSPVASYAERAVTPEPAMSVPEVANATSHATLVASDAVWEGKLHSDGDVRIEGTVRGEIVTAATLVVAPHARVHATIQARNITIAGDVEGDVTCDERLEILPGGSARGQINSAKLVVHEGAYIDSRFQMRRDGGA